MKITILSDTHGDLPKVEKTDLFIHCGDLCPDIFPAAQANFVHYDFIPWINDVPAKFKVFIAGNHDFVFERDADILQFYGLNENVVYLRDSSVRYNGCTIYGSPWTPRFGNWAFMKQEEDIEYPEEHIDILVTHGPPFGILDKNHNGTNCGSKALLKRSKLPDIKLNCFGHIHEARGIEDKFVNASYWDREYVRKRFPIIIEKLE